MRIRIDDLAGPEVINLVQEHLQGMVENTPLESIHALGLEELRKPDITFWSVWDGAKLAGIGALKEHCSQHAEIKSMRTASAHLRKGVAARLLQHMFEVAKDRGYQRLSLETGSHDAFEPARRLYSSFGFAYCDPFADYIYDPNTVFMTKNYEYMYDGE